MSFTANKRTAFACMAYFLFVNGYILVMNEEKASDLTVNLVVGQITFKEVSMTLRKHSYRKSSQ